MDSSFYTVPVAVQHGSAATVRPCDVRPYCVLLDAQGVARSLSARP